MDYLMMAVFLIITVLILYLYKKVFSVTSKGSRIPGPSFLPGLTIFLKGSIEEKLHLYLPDWAEKYGEIVQVNLLATNVVIINDAGLFQRLVKSVEFRDYTNDRPPSFFAQHYGFNKDISFAPLGPDLKFRRKLFHNLLKFYGEGIGQFEQLMIKTLTEMVIGLRQHDKVNLSLCIENYIVSLIGFLCTGDVSENAQRNLTKIKTLSDWSLLTAQFSHDVIMQLFPFLRFIPGLRFRRYHSAMVKAMKDVHKSYFEDMKKTFDPDCRRGFIDELLFKQSQLDKENNGRQLEDGSIKALMQDIILAGYVTTTFSLSALFLQLIKDQKIQDKIHAEIKAVIGNSTPTFQHKHKMPYTEAVIMESLRLSSIAPVLFPHLCNRDVFFEGYHIPKSTILIMNAFYNHHRADYWEEPYVFKPERFLTPGGQLVDITHPARQKLVPFGTGPRSCPGETFARSRMFLITTFLVKELQFLPDDDAPLPSSDPRNWLSSAGICPQIYTCTVQSRI